MERLAKSLVLALILSLLATAAAVAQQRAYAPENLRTLSRNDQIRVISLEYEEQAGRRIPDDQLRFYLDQVNRSDWGFSRIRQDIGQSLGGGGGSQPGQRIRCESVNNRSQICQTPWTGPSRLVRQLSGSACDEGRTWQSQRGQVYVGGGCRGEFEAAPTGHQLGTVRCESVNNRPRTCRTPWSGHSRLARQLSGSACEEGRTWQSQRGQVSVSGGCRADFVAAPVLDPNYSVTCSSVRMRPNQCRWNNDHGPPRLERQLSNSNCLEGQTWGHDRNRGIWVNSGCSGRFVPMRPQPR
ncbi:Protein of unknown function (DUF3011) [Luteimonas cucumeris]|uniref:DUF3011 family protein n=1 Tax=Luteimonas cucumeris TaxID=985012 RepID=A0A562L5Q9_9GAMM|nr:DUF3011 domain-containing protein [Luteimonas cucumeris]TWI02774.1 Protein of unknown function (DUF3011) [Luteimonas cucumeris]